MNRTFVVHLRGALAVLSLAGFSHAASPACTEGNPPPTIKSFASMVSGGGTYQVTGVGFDNGCGTKGWKVATTDGSYSRASDKLGCSSDTTCVVTMPADLPVGKKAIVRLGFETGPTNASPVFQIVCDPKTPNPTITGFNPTTVAPGQVFQVIGYGFDNGCGALPGNGGVIIDNYNGPNIQEYFVEPSINSDTLATMVMPNNALPGAGAVQLQFVTNSTNAENGLMIQ